jgi:small subunit ribosomal protein S3e
MYAWAPCLHQIHSMKGWDPTGESGPKNPLPDMVQITEPGIDKVFAEPTSEQRGPGAEQSIAPPLPLADEEYGGGEAAAEPVYQEQEGGGEAAGY